jgi:hypothetical protein
LFFETTLSFVLVSSVYRCSDETRQRSHAQNVQNTAYIEVFGVTRSLTRREPCRLRCLSGLRGTVLPDWPARYAA